MHLPLQNILVLEIRLHSDIIFGVQVQDCIRRTDYCKEHPRQRRILQTDDKVAGYFLNADLPVNIDGKVFKA